MMSIIKWFLQPILPLYFGGGSSPDTSGQNEAARVNAEIAREMWDEYRGTYLPMERQFAADAANYASPERYAKEAGKAQAEVSEQFGKARDRLTRTPGLDPSSAAATAGYQKMDMAEAAAGAVAQNKARNYVEEMGHARLQDAISIGKGMPGTASQATAAAGNAYGQIAGQQAQYNQQQSNDMSNLVGGGIAAARLYKDFGGSFKDGGPIKRKPIFLAVGGFVGNPRMRQVMENNAASASVPQPSGGGDNTISNGIQAIKTGKKMYDGAMAGVAGEGVAGGIAGGTGVTAGAGAAEALGSGIGASTAGTAGGVVGGTGLTAGTGAAGALGTGTAGAGLAGGVAGGTGLVAGTGAASTLGAGAAATAGAAGAASAAAPTLAAAGPVGWAIGAGLLAASLFADGGEIKSGPDDIDGRANGLDGGMVSGPGGPRDDLVPIMGSDGEFMINAKAVNIIGRKKLIEMNNLGLPKHKRSKA